MWHYKLFFLFLLVLIIPAGIASAATVHGTIYDMSLRKLSDARVEINTSPKQFLIAQNGSYSFNAPNGAYTIKAQLMHKNTIIASVNESITIKQDGNYVLDMILFPDIEEGVGDIDIDVNGDVVEQRNKQTTIGYVILALIGVILAGIALFKKHKKQEKQIYGEETKTEQKEEKYQDNELEQLIKIIKQEGGRATQKDIRKQIPLSEAKISLMIAELEHKGIVEKIKRGRGNIIILKEK